MAPLCADPRQVVIALEPATRAALLKLIEEITAFMTLQLINPPDELGSLTDDESNGNNDDVDRPSSDNRKDQTSPDPSPQVPDHSDLDTNPRLTKKPSQFVVAQPSGKAARKIEQIQESAMMHMQEWKNEFLPRLQEIMRVEDNAKIKEERKARREGLDEKDHDTTEEEDHVLNFGNVPIDRAQDVASLQKLYHPIPNTLTATSPRDRREAISCVLLLLLSTGKYSAHSRVMVLYLASALEVPQTFVNTEEAEIAHSLIESSSADKDKKEAMSAEAEAESRRQKNKFSRFWKVGLASVAGATVIGVTGGLAAPLVAGAFGAIMGGVGLGGVASFLGVFWMNGALVGALFGAYGAKMTGELMDKYAKEVEDFKFIPLEPESGPEFKPPSADGGSEITKDKAETQGQENRRLRVTIGINGWLNSEDDITKPWRALDSASEVFALRYEMKTLLSLGTALKDLVSSFAWKTLKVEIIKRTVLATLFAALWPIQIIAAASNVDNPFSRASNRSKKAGQLLADALINKVQGERPVTLVGYSLGATAIHACLQSLADRQAFGLVESVVIIGTPAPSHAPHWRTLRCVVSGPIFNVYSENDMVLGFVYRMHSLALGVAGLQAIENVNGLHNLDLSERVSGHLRYPSITGEILKECGFLGVRASGEIEKDDVIKMKEEHAEGKLVDLENAAGKEDAKQEEESEITQDLKGLSVSSPGEAKDENGGPMLPARVGQEAS
ncbi:hypothetical protein E4U57_003265 [Claviceps arundinis]|uniref:Uncharacterized protein n=1 Tax=Claviceps arundinis TaxID=1623583 RepID=A0A9P7MRZ3_9HYPO|nr:hypothetical protein E4U57_003265 [Claviceps arundinis]KAG5966992.1 hypothetical protein E4U56_001019 [Claviceps arundinis]